MTTELVPTHIRRLWWGLVGWAFLAGACLLTLSLSSYDALQRIAGVFAADHIANSFTPALYRHALLPARLLAGAILILTLASCFTRTRAQRCLAVLVNGIMQGFRRLWSDASHFWKDCIKAGLARVSHWEWVYLATSIIFAVACRLPLINDPMQHDESYTVTAFASHSLRTVLSDYHLPNNHVFHTILVHFSISLFGNHPWSVRIPALLAGVLTIPAIYFLAKRLYGRPTAVLAAGLACPAEELVNYSTDARGYTFIVLFTLIAAVLAADVLRRKNWMAWSLFILTSALGFYTIPIFLLPFGALLTWMAFDTISGGTLPAYQNRLTFLLYLAVAGLAVVLLTGIFYSPVLVQSGVKSLLGNSFIGSSVLREYPSRILENVVQTWSEWMGSYPPAFGIFSLLGLALSFVITEKKKYHVHLALACAVFILAEIGLHRPGLATKLWVFLFPLCIIWVSAGWSGLATRVLRFSPFQKQVNLAVSVLIILFLAGWNLARFAQLLPAAFAPPGPEELMALEIKGLLQPGDIVITGSPADAPMMYYLERHAVPRSIYTKLKNKPFRRAFVVLYDPYQQTVADIISSWGPNVALFELSSAHFTANHGPVSLYVVLSKGTTNP